MTSNNSRAEAAPHLGGVCDEALILGPRCVCRCAHPHFWQPLDQQPAGCSRSLLNQNRWNGKETGNRTRKEEEEFGPCILNFNAELQNSTPASIYMQQHQDYKFKPSPNGRLARSPERSHAFGYGSSSWRDRKRPIASRRPPRSGLLARVSGTESMLVITPSRVRSDLLHSSWHQRKR